MGTDARAQNVCEMKGNKEPPVFSFILGLETEVRAQNVYKGARATWSHLPFRSFLDGVRGGDAMGVEWAKGVLWLLFYKPIVSAHLFSIQK